MDGDNSTESPLFSVVVIAHNVESYIERCMRSVLNQHSEDFELIVVDDASTDQTLQRISAIADGDPRVSVVKKNQNEGAHLARRTGVAHTVGKFVYFLDGDDELCPHFFGLSSGLVTSVDADVYRLGCRVVLESEGEEEHRAIVEHSLNDSRGRALGEDILLRSFSDKSAHADTWRLVSCLYRGEVCRSAFRMMTEDRLGYMEDAYEFFVVASCSAVLENATDLVAQRYNLGSGRSGYSHMSYDEFVKRQSEVFDLVRSVYSFAEDDGRDVTRRCARWFEGACLRTISNEWTVRLASETQILSVSNLVDTWGHVATLGMLTPPLIGRAQWVLEDDSRLDDALLASWRAAYAPLLDSPDIEVEGGEGAVFLLGLLRQIDDHRTARDREVRERLELEMARESVFPRRVLNALLPRGSKMRRVLSAVARELRS